MEMKFYFILLLLLFDVHSSNGNIERYLFEDLQPPTNIYQIKKGQIPKVDEIIDRIKSSLNVIENGNLTEIEDYQEKILRGFLQTKSIPTQEELEKLSSMEKYSKRKIKVRKRKGVRYFYNDLWILNKGCLVLKDLKTKKFKNEKVRVSGFHYLLPGGYMGWHTNIHDPLGWRLYYVEVRDNDNNIIYDQCETDTQTDCNSQHESYFQYLNPYNTSELIKVKDKSGYYNLFKLRSKEEGPLWHSTYSDDSHRFSIGFHIEDEDLIKDFIN